MAGAVHQGVQDGAAHHALLAKRPKTAALGRIEGVQAAQGFAAAQAEHVLGGAPCKLCSKAVNLADAALFIHHHHHQWGVAVNGFQQGLLVGLGAVKGTVARFFPTLLNGHTARNGQCHA